MRTRLEPDSVDLLFADPPFNLGQDYLGYDDNREDFSAYLAERIRLCPRVVRPGGAVVWHVPDRWAALTYTVLAETLEPVNWIILHQEFGQFSDGRFIVSKVHCLYFAKPGGKRTFNVEEVLEPSARLLSGDKRVSESRYGGMRPFLDVWYGPYLGRVQGNSAERCKAHPNQLPEMYLARIARALSNSGDVVYDPFVGSGTTLVVAEALGRRACGSEISPDAAKSARERVRRGPVRNVSGSLVTRSDASGPVSDE